MTTHETARSIILTLKADLVKWIKTYQPDLIRCRLQNNDKAVTSDEIKRAIADNFENTLGLSRRLIAYFSNPSQKHLADRLEAEIRAVRDPEAIKQLREGPNVNALVPLTLPAAIDFDAREKNVTGHYLFIVCAVSSTLDDCLLAVPEPMPPRVSAQNSQSQTKPGLSTEAKALACLAEHPDWTDTRIAKEIGCNRTTLYNYQLFTEARQIQKGGKKDLLRGCKDGQTGDIEAWED